MLDYRDPRWQRRRLEILEAREWSCEQCSDYESELHVHHTFYVKGQEPWEASDGQLQVLCRDCHDLATERTRRMRVLLGVLAAMAPLDVLESLEADLEQQARAWVGTTGPKGWMKPGPMAQRDDCLRLLDRAEVC